MVSVQDHGADPPKYTDEQFEGAGENKVVTGDAPPPAKNHQSRHFADLQAGYLTDGSSTQSLQQCTLQTIHDFTGEAGSLVHTSVATF